MTVIEFRRRPVYFISIAATIVSVPPRTLRIYETEGLIEPGRRNSLRLYSDADLERVRLIRYLTQGRGVNLAGVRILFDLLDAGRLLLADLISDQECAADFGIEVASTKAHGTVRDWDGIPSRPAPLPARTPFALPPTKD